MTVLLRCCFLLAILGAAACGDDRAPVTVDLLLAGGMVFDGDADKAPAVGDVGISDGKITFIGDAAAAGVVAGRSIDVSGLLVTAGFIDPHTHSLTDLRSDDKNANLNYLMQGVTTVVNGNDGGGSAELGELI